MRLFRNKTLRVLLAILAVQTGLYPSIYFILNRKFGLLQSKTDALLANSVWNIFFYTHIVLGGVALLIGWTQFNGKWRARNIKRHRQVGFIYVTASLISSIAAVYIALYATGGWMASLGFICLGTTWFGTTLKAFNEIRNGHIAEHQKMMIYSYAACFAAATLRIYFPVLNILFHHDMKVYILCAWLCWIPNLIVAFFLVKQIGRPHKAFPS